ncbi:MAG: hypothetical protein VKK04_00095 [Synechococcales bacterium]|nr:hypothetical protein [Synechococcales bacterium]
MGAIARYWRLVRINSGGRRVVAEIVAAKALISQVFPALMNQFQVADGEIQPVLFDIFHHHPASSERTAAEYCLRCVVSHHIEQVCIQLELRFGYQHSFSRYDLFGLVLEDDGRSPLPPPVEGPRSLVRQILTTFDPAQARLATWVMRQVRHHPEVKAFLQEQGVCLVTDWALLKDTRVDQARQILTDFHALVTEEVNQAGQLLQTYHAVYRGDRLRQQQQGQIKGRAECVPPTPEQLERMAAILQAQTHFPWSAERVMERLQSLARHLRQYRVYSRSGALPTESLDQPNTQELAAAVPAPLPDDEREAREDFLNFYRDHLVVCLDQAVAQVMGDRLNYLQRKKPQMVQPFLQALHLFHCRGYSMGEIAPLVGLKAQFQVTRLMKLKEFRASVQALLIKLLFDHVFDQAQSYLEVERLQALAQQIAAALSEDVAALMQRAEAEATAVKHRPLTSLFAQRLCCYLETRSLAS